jgi:hypothetical protein
VLVLFPFGDGGSFGRHVCSTDYERKPLTMISHRKPRMFLHQVGSPVYGNKAMVLRADFPVNLQRGKWQDVPELSLDVASWVRVS